MEDTVQNMKCIIFTVDPTRVWDVEAIYWVYIVTNDGRCLANFLAQINRPYNTYNPTQSHILWDKSQ